MDEDAVSARLKLDLELRDAIARLLARFREKDNVLPRKGIYHFLKLVPFRCHFRFHLVNGHLMFRANRYSRIFLPKFQQDQFPIGLQRFSNTVKHALRPGKFVIDINQQDQIQLARRQPRVRFRPKNCLHIRYVLSRCIRTKAIEHSWLNIVGVDDSTRQDALSDSQAVETRTCSDIGDEHSGLQIERGQGFFRLLFAFALLAIKPIRTAHSHYRSNASSGNGMDSLSARTDRRNQQCAQQAGGVVFCGACARIFHHLTFRFGRMNLDSKKTHRKTSIQKRCAWDDVSTSRVSSSMILGLLLLLMPRFCTAANSSLAIVDAGVQESEDSPFAPSDYRFLPGDYVYFTFQITGFEIRSLNRGEVRKISLNYDVRPEDANGIPLTASSSGSIETELSPEDKHWTPKRRASFLLPSFIGAGDFHIHVVVKDAIAKTEISKDFAFRVGGLEVKRTNSIEIETFQFFRNENDDQPLDLAAYAPGDTVYARFEMVGFKTGPQNGYHLSYGVTVLGPDGKPFLQAPHAAELADATFYPAQYLPGALSITTSSSSTRGEYIAILTVRDLIANTNYEIKKAFSLE